MTIESRLTDVEKKQKHLRNAKWLQGRRMSATAPSDLNFMGFNSSKGIWEPKAGVLNASLTQAKAESSTDEETLYSFTIPADTLGATGGFKLTLGGDAVVNAAGTLVLKVKLGSTTVLTSGSADFYNSVNSQKWTLVVTCKNSSPSAQKWLAEFALVQASDNLAIRREDEDLGFAGGRGYNTSSEDTTTALALTVTAQWSASSANLSFRKEIAILERIGLSAGTGGGGGASTHDDLTGVTSGQHHTKYLDSEAITAAKTVKLDDFTTPDDNTDLNATTALHGLLLKLGGGTTNFLRADGSWSTPAGGGDVTAAANIADNAIVRGDGGAKGVQESLVICDDQGNITGVLTLNLEGDAAGEALFQATAISDVGSAFGRVKFRRALVGPAAVVNGTLLGAVEYAGYGTSAYQIAASILARATETHATNQHGAELGFYTSPDSAGAVVQRWVIGQDGNLASQNSYKLTGLGAGSSDGDSVRYEQLHAALALASIGETDTGTEAGKAVTPDGLAGSNYGERTIGLLVSDPGGDAITTGDGKVYARIPSTMNGWNLVEVAASLSTVSSSGIPTVQVRRSRRSTATTRTDADMLDGGNDRLTIDATHYDSEDATDPAVINGSNADVNEGDHIYIDIDGAGTGAKGLFATLTFRLP